MPEPMKADSFDFAERLQVLDAVERNLRSAILNVNNPQHMVEHAEKLERDADVLLQQARHIREILHVDSLNIAEIHNQLKATVREQRAIQYAVRRGWKPKYIRRLLALAAKMEGLDELLEQGEILE